MAPGTPNVLATEIVLRGLEIPHSDKELTDTCPEVNPALASIVIELVFKPEVMVNPAGTVQV